MESNTSFLRVPDQVFDDGFNPREPGTFGLSKTLGGGGGGTGGGADDLKRPKRNELGCVLYASNVLGSRGPRKMQVTQFVFFIQYVRGSCLL